MGRSARRQTGDGWPPGVCDVPRRPCRFPQGRIGWRNRRLHCRSSRIRCESCGHQSEASRMAKILRELPDTHQFFAGFPGGVVVEFTEDTSLDVPIKHHHIHFSTPGMWSRCGPGMSTCLRHSGNARQVRRRQPICPELICRGGPRKKHRCPPKVDHWTTSVSRLRESTICLQRPRKRAPRSILLHRDARVLRCNCRNFYRPVGLSE